MGIQDMESNRWTECRLPIRKSDTLRLTILARLPKIASALKVFGSQLVGSIVLHDSGAINAGISVSLLCHIAMEVGCV